MLRLKLFRKHFAIAAASVLVCILVGTSLSVFTVQRMIGHNRAQPVVLYARLVERFGQGDPQKGLQEVEKLRDEGQRSRLILLDKDGLPLDGKTRIEGKIKRFPSRPYEVISSEEMHLMGELHRTLVRLNYDPPIYLLMAQTAPRPSPGAFPLFPATFALLVFMVLLGVAIGLGFIFNSLNAQVQIADQVISELKRGNLKARFKLGRNDEIGQAMERFNQMADEIERLVERLQTAENSRNLLLQELTHDLRTPVASLRSLLETIFTHTTLSREMGELSDLAAKEVDYINRLLEDLLLLARVSEPRYRPNQRPVDFLAVLEAEADAVAIRYQGKVKLELNFHEAEALVSGDEHLLRRLARNGLENAFSFASSKVVISSDYADGMLKVKIRDDGRGLDAEAVARFGERRAQRTFERTSGGRLSLGLGSVIMKAVVDLHRGKLSVGNAPEGGALLEFALPMASASKNAT
jgi:signal transduction histidine kinase